MGSTQSAEVVEEEESEEEDEEEDEEEEEDDHDEGLPSTTERELENNQLAKKVLEQEPEMLPCHASASPLSPQLSSSGTPRLGSSIKVWDPFNVLAAPPPPVIPRSFSNDDDPSATYVYLISHGECEIDLRQDLVGGRCEAAALTPKGKRQARALAVFLNSQEVRFDSVYCSPLDRARSMAVSVCQEINFAEQQIQSSDAITEMSMGCWEGCLRSETYTTEILSLVDKYQPDFCAPSGESLREVEFRMVQFLNRTILGLNKQLRSDFPSHSLTNSVHSAPPPNFDMIQRNRQWLPRRKSGKSRLQFVSSTGDHDADDEMSPRESGRQIDLHSLNIRSTPSPPLPPPHSNPHCIGVFTHSLPIKCLVIALLGCSPVMSQKICVEDSSVTVLQYSSEAGWQIKRLNDTTHLRLL